MFDVGKFYKMQMWEPGDDGGLITDYHYCKVTRIEGTLLAVKQSVSPEQIVNTASVVFVGAMLEKDQS
jgi:hypothetical protein